MPRNLRAAEKNVLAYCIVDPDAWWAHCQSVSRNPEADLAAKVARFKTRYDRYKTSGDYQTKKVRFAKDPEGNATDNYFTGTKI